MTGQRDREYAAHSRRIADRQLASIGFDCAARHRQPEADPGLVAALLEEGNEHLVHVPGRQPAAVVADVDEYPRAGSVGGQLDLGVRLREFETVLEQVLESGKKKCV